MNTNKISKTVLALSLLFTSFSCSVSPIAIQTDNKTQIKQSQENNGTLVINLDSIFGSENSSSKHKFSLKRYKFDDSTVDEIVVSVYSTNANGDIILDSQGMKTPEVSKTIKRSDGLSELFLSVPAGKNKVAVIETFDIKDVQLSRLMGALTIYGGNKTTLSVNYGTYPTAEILKKLMSSTDINDRKLAYSLDLEKLNAFVNKLTAYDINSNTYGGINPSYLDTTAIINNLKTNKTMYGDVSIPTSKADVKAYMFVTSKNMLKVSTSGVVSNDLASTNMITFNGKVAVGDIIFLHETDSFGINEKSYQFTVTAVNTATNTFTLDKNLTVPSDRMISSISFPDRKKYDNEVKGKLRLTVKNAKGDILRGVKYEINDLTSENVSSSYEDTTTIENVSQGKWLLRVTVSNEGKNLQYFETLDIKAGNTYIEKTIIPTESVVQSIRLENINDNDNLPVPANIDLTLGYSINIKAIVRMTDGTENQNVTWTSSDTNVANASGGNVSASNAGTAIITAAATENLNIKQSFTVTVTKTQTDGPMINSFSPNASGVGTEILIKGDRFDDASLLSTTVRFNGTLAEVVDVKKTEIKVKVPALASTGKITITTAKGSFVSQDYFIINSPINSDTTGMVFIPSTEKFFMGYSGSEDDNFYPRHKVVLNSFHIDRTEVTNEDFKKFIDSDGYITDANWSTEGLRFRNDSGLNNKDARPSYWDDTRFNQPKQPVVGISWYEAQAYSTWKGRRLPTEAEWEYAARGTDERMFPWGSDFPSDGNKKANGFYGTLGNGDDFQYTNEAGKYANGDSPFGLKDMSGNAYEWVNDFYDSKYYSENVVENPNGPSVGGSKVLRGGSWYNHPYFNNDTTKMGDSMKSYSRFFSSPTNRSNYIGFRTAR